MQPTKPFFHILGDSDNNIMARSGELVGYSKTRFVWRYGFLPDSDSANAYNVHTDSFTWVISTYNGKVLDTFIGYALELPQRYQDIINA